MVEVEGASGNDGCAEGFEKNLLIMLLYTHVFDYTEKLHCL
jgi:hypothetical protein